MKPHGELPYFLTVEDVLLLHEVQLGRFGGGAGLRDLPLLESAVAQPAATFAGSFVHTSLYEMAAAYLYHIVKNHPFIDGNKRTGLLSALTFLDTNGIRLLSGSASLYELTLGVAAGGVDKEQVATVFEDLAASR